MIDLKNVVVYGKDNCVFCIYAERILEQMNVDYTMKKLGVDFEREELLTINPEAKSYPQIIIDGNAIGGYSELRNIFTQLEKEEK